MSTGRPDDRLQRIERAGSEIAINNPECSERSRRCRLAGDACKRQIVFVNDAGWHDLVSLRRQSKCNPHACCRRVACGNIALAELLDPSPSLVNACPGLSVLRPRPWRVLPSIDLQQNGGPSPS